MSVGVLLCICCFNDFLFFDLPDLTNAIVSFLTVSLQKHTCLTLKGQQLVRMQQLKCWAFHADVLLNVLPASDCVFPAEHTLSPLRVWFNVRVLVSWLHLFSSDLSLSFCMLISHTCRCVMSGADVEVYLSQVHDGSVSSGFRALYEERLLLDVTLLIEEHHFQVHLQTRVWITHAREKSTIADVRVHPLAGPQGASGNPERLLPGHVHSRHEGEGPGQDPHEGADGCRVRPHPQVHVLRVTGAQHAHCPGDFAGNATDLGVSACCTTVLHLTVPSSYCANRQPCMSSWRRQWSSAAPSCWPRSVWRTVLRSCASWKTLVLVWRVSRSSSITSFLTTLSPSWTDLTSCPTWALRDCRFLFVCWVLARQPAHFCRINHTVNKSFSTFKFC